VRRYGRVIGALVLLGLIVVFVDEEREYLPALRSVVERADWRWLVVAVAAEIAVVVATVLTYGAVLRRLGHRLAWWSLVDAFLRSVVAGTLSPVGAAGSVVGMRSLTDRGVLPDDAVLAWSLGDLTAFGSSLLVLLPTAALLAVRGRLPEVVLVAVGVLTVLLGAAAALLAMLLGGDGVPGWLVRRLPRRVTVFLERARAHHLRVSDLLPALGWSVLGEIGTIAVLGAALRAVDPHGSSPAAPLIAYEVGNAAQLAAPVYQGIGAVELAVTVALRREGVSRHAALAAALLYRVCVVWLPLAIGLLWQSKGRLGLPRRRSLGSGGAEDTMSLQTVAATTRCTAGRDR
jgi:uncharacterized membrane protein YbhN (UPF0104 family)